jgi:dTDP-4-dehydrorhamnose reductase
MKILLIGATGQLGTDLLRANPGHEIITPTRIELDLLRPDQIASSILAARPAFVINCAAFHDLVLCEREPEQAFLVNCIAVRNLAAACADVGAWLITFSTDYVFDGSKRTGYLECDSPHPLQVYGISRLAGEYAAMVAVPERFVIVRTCGLYGRAGSQSRGSNFVNRRVADARAGRRIEISCEQFATPTWTEDLSGAIFALIGNPELAPGIYHLVNEGSCSWYEFTRAIVDIIGCEVEVAPIDRKGRDMTGFRRPIFSVLRNRRAADLGISLPSWESALRRYLTN